MFNVSEGIPQSFDLSQLVVLCRPQWDRHRIPLSEPSVTSSSSRVLEAAPGVVFERRGFCRHRSFTFCDLASEN
ncbi:hypothetical protein F2P81_024725 [Scophthalmus maximus]|uniref:Uncharacterized protein n=1 Tax=Scophthalmus maximus TaxID=52904 RepID=A0A6A4RW88_SCOMX|nr:hypothetical protein F2P81_024725 [Scophthalmus maximus]